MSLAGVIARFSTGAGDGVPGGYSITRTAQGAHNSAGDFVPGSTSTILITASVQPDNGRALRVTSAGRKSDDVIVILTNTALVIESPATAADVITYHTERYEVYRVDGPFWLGGAAHYEAYAARQVTP